MATSLPTPLPEIDPVDVWNGNLPTPQPDPDPTPSTLMAIVQTFTATAGQTLFALTDFTYTVAGHELMVYVDGVYQNPTNYTETSTSSITMNFSTLAAGDTVDIVKVA